MSAAAQGAVLVQISPPTQVSRHGKSAGVRLYVLRRCDDYGGSAATRREEEAMNHTGYEQAFNEAAKLTKRSEDALYEQLGLRIQDMQNIGGYERSKQYSAEFAQEAEAMLLTEDLKQLVHYHSGCTPNNVSIDLKTGDMVQHNVVGQLDLGLLPSV